MIYVTQNEDIYEIKFKYDVQVIQQVKAVPGRRWLPDKKIWTIPKDSLGFLIKAFEGTQYEGTLQIHSDEDINENAALDTTTQIPNIDLSGIPFYVKKGAKPYKHQLDFMKWALYRQNCGDMRGFLLADDQGLAKTCESMNLALYNKKQYGFKHCLVICCINSSKYNWKADIEDHTKGQYVPYILGDRYKKNGSIRPGSGAEKLYDLEHRTTYGNKTRLPYFIIMNIEAIRMKSKGKYCITKQIIDLINQGQINMVILDEIHRNASPTSAQGKQILEIKKKTKDKAIWIPMTGTPITNKPTDLYTPLRLFDGHSYKSFYSWCRVFCVYGGFGGKEIIGYKNIPMLKNMVTPNMLRRMKSDVLDLPPKIRYDEYVYNTPYQDKLYSIVQNDLKEKEDEIVLNLNPMARLLRLRQVNGSPELVDDTISVDKKYLSRNAKLQRLMELLEEINERGEKVIVFSNWVEPLRTLYAYVYKQYNTCVFTGTMTTQEREHHKKVFMTNPNYTVMLGTIGAAGTSHTFTSATNIIFYDEPWTPADKLQAEDRIYRIGTTKSVNIYTLITKNTVDEKVHDILYKKSTMSQYLIDNKLDLYKNRDMLDWLIS